ncbi:hypothetical protein STVA_38930 [Allostella vacuolata]|nr:hypothetical protein STVA_38930 [Stella vacuolata]
MRRVAALLGAALLAATRPAAADSLPPHPFLAYHASWFEPATSDPAQTTIARLPAFIDVLILSFARPDLDYRAGSLDLAGTGLHANVPGPVLRDAIALLRQRRPAVKVLLAVGGWGHFGWHRLNQGAIAQLVRDLGADGVDIDHEPEHPGCAPRPDGRIACRSDLIAIDSVNRLRKALPRPYLITTAGWSVGAYGEGAWAGAVPASPWTGSMLALLRSPAAAHLDLVSIMTYDAGPAYDPAEAQAAYRHYWKGPLALGVQVPFDDQRDRKHTLATAAGIVRQAAADPGGGVMLYALQVTPPGTVGPDNPDDRMLATAICRGLGRATCAWDGR